MIPNTIKDRILSKVSLVQLMEREGISFSKTGRQYIALCPFHKEKTPSFSVNDEQGLYYCFGCHAKGNAITFLKEYKKMSFFEAMEYLAEIVHEDIKPFLSGKNGEKDRRQDYVFMYQKACDFYQSVLWSEKGTKAKEYLVLRGLREEIIKSFRLGYSPGFQELGEFLRSYGIDYPQMITWGLLSRYEQRDRFAFRLIFPIYDKDGSPIAFGGRVLDNENSAKYINSPDTPWFKKGDVLYGFFQSKESLMREKRAILVEGYMDVIGLHQAGITYAVAPLGTALTEAQLQLLQRYVDKIILLFDGDNAGLSAASRSIDMLIETPMEGKVVILPHGMDPDEMVIQQGKEAFLAFVETHAMYPIDFKWMYIRDYQLKGLSQKKQTEEIFRFISKASQTVMRNEMIKRLAGELNVRVDVLYEDFLSFLRYSRKTKPSLVETSLQTLQQDTLAAEHERELLAIVFHYPVKEDLVMIEELITPEMFTQEKYRKWFFSFIEQQLSLASMYDEIQEDNKLFDLLIKKERETITENALMEAIYFFRAQYFKRKKVECSVQIQHAKEKGLGPAQEDEWQKKKMKWETEYHEAMNILREYGEKSINQL